MTNTKGKKTNWYECDKNIPSVDWGKKADESNNTKIVERFTVRFGYVYQRSGSQESLSTLWKARRQPLPGEVNIYR